MPDGTKRNVTISLMPEAVHAYMRKRLTGVWEAGWKKTRNKNPRTYGPKPKGSGAHTSVYRVLQKHKDDSLAGDGTG